MDQSFRRVNPTEIPDNVFKMIGEDWMLITAGVPGDYNTMTASWGGLGELWHKKVCFCFVRPQRHTYSFMERTARFTLSFFAEDHRDTLQFCGAHSGRDVDKAERTGLTPMATPGGAVSFQQARLVLECRKIYFQDLLPGNFLDPAIQECYPQKDYHRMYIGEVEACLIR